MVCSMEHSSVLVLPFQQLNFEGGFPNVTWIAMYWYQRLVVDNKERAACEGFLTGRMKSD